MEKKENNEQKQQLEPSKRIQVHGIELTKNQAYNLWLKGLLAGPTRQEISKSAWRSGL